MPTKSEVWLAADALRAKNEMVSIRTVRPMLRNGGSFRDIGPHLASWKKARAYQPGIELAGLPDFLQTKVAQAASEMWEAAMQAATKHLEAAREQAAAGIAIERELRDEALSAADKLEFETSVLRREVERLTVELGEAKSKADSFQVELMRIRSDPPDPTGARKEARDKSRKAWDKLISELGDILRRLPTDSPGLTLDELLEAITPEMRQFAYEKGQEIDRRILQKKIATRVTHGRYVTRVGQYYHALPEAQAAD